MVYIKSVKITIDASSLIKVFIYMIVRHDGLPDTFDSDRGSVFTHQFWYSLCHFLVMKPSLSTAFYPQAGGQTKKQNSKIEAYLRAFLHYEQKN